MHCKKVNDRAGGAAVGLRQTACHRNKVHSLEEKTEVYGALSACSLLACCNIFISFYSVNAMQHSNATTATRAVPVPVPVAVTVAEAVATRTAFSSSSIFICIKQKTKDSRRGISFTKKPSQPRRKVLRPPAAQNKSVGITQQILLFLSLLLSCLLAGLTKSLYPSPASRQDRILRSTQQPSLGLLVSTAAKRIYLTPTNATRFYFISFYFSFAPIVSVWHIGHIVSPTVIDANWCVLLMEFLLCGIGNMAGGMAHESMQHKLGGKQTLRMEKLIMLMTVFKRSNVRTSSVRIGRHFL